MSQPHSILRIATPRSQEAIINSWYQFLLGIPSIQDKWWQKALLKHERLSVELLWHAGLLELFLVAPTRISTLISQLLIGWIPQVSVTYENQDPIQVLKPQIDENLLASTVYPTQKSLRQLSTNFPTDPLAGLFATLTTLPTSTSLIWQTIISPTIVHNPPVKNTGDELSATAKDATQTTSQRFFQVNWRVGATTQDLLSAQMSIESLLASYSIFTQSDSQFFKKPRFVKNAHAFELISSRKSNLIFTTKLPAQVLATMIHPPGIDLAHLSNIAWGKHLQGEPPALLPVVSSASSAEKENINPFASTVFKNEQVIYGLRRTDRRRHLYAIGKTGTGKSTLLANMAIHDLKKDEGLCVIDPHGDLVETLLDYIPSRRINDVIYFDPSDSERTVKLNLFEGESVVHRELIASGIVSVFKKLYGYSWGPRLEHILRNALLTLLKSDEARLSDITDLLTNKKYRDSVVSQLDDPILKNFWVNEFDAMQDRLRAEAVAPVLNKVGQFVSSPLVRDVVNARKSSFSIEDVMNTGKILLANLSQGKLGEDNATLLGAMLITKIQLAAMARVHQPEELRKDFFLYVDEFQNFATESFTKILSEARKYRLNLTLANQYTAQIPDEVQKAIFGNCGSIVSFVMGAEDATLFSKEFSGKYSPEDLVSLQKHQVINRLTIENVISEAFAGFTLPLASSKNNNREKVLRSSKERYAKKK